LRLSADVRAGHVRARPARALPARGRPRAPVPSARRARWIACFSTGQRASTSLLDLTAKFVCMQRDGAERILKKNQARDTCRPSLQISHAPTVSDLQKTLSALAGRCPAPRACGGLKKKMRAFGPQSSCEQVQHVARRSCGPQARISQSAPQARGCGASADSARLLKKTCPPLREQEQLFIKGNGPADLRRLFSYPSSVAGLKGVGGKIILLEEASRLDEAVFTEVIVPLFGVKDTVVLGISTPLEANNFYSQLLQAKKPDGSPLFNVLEVTTLCDACLASGKLECPHKTELPAWKTSERQELVKSLMVGRGDAMYLREACGVITQSDTAVFNAVYLARLNSRENRVPMASVAGARHGFVAIDPCGGGASAMAIASGVFLADGTLIVVGADARAVTTDEDMEAVLRAHVGLLRETAALANAQIVLIIERNYGGGVLASRIASVCADGFGNVACMTQDTNPKLRRSGVVTTAPVKERMRVEFSRLLRCNAVHFSEPFCSSAPDMRGTIVDQLKNYRLIIKEGTETAGPKFALSGKTYGKSDDVCIAVQILAWWPHTFFADGDRCLL
jgi:hypothetical protein